MCTVNDFQVVEQLGNCQCRSPREDAPERLSTCSEEKQDSDVFTFCPCESQRWDSKCFLKENHQSECTS